MTPTESLPPQGPASAQERRRSPRQACRALFALCKERQPDLEELRAGQVRDTSTDGIGVLLSRPYRPGTELNVELQDSGGWVKNTVRVRVVHASRHPSDRWLMGCSLLAEAS